jgi:hypothetical protein
MHRGWPSFFLVVPELASRRSPDSSSYAHPKRHVYVSPTPFTVLAHTFKPCFITSSAPIASLPSSESLCGPLIDPLHTSWTKCARTTVTLRIRSAGGGNGGSRCHAPPRGSRFVWALSNSRATRALCVLFAFSFSLCLH